MELFHKDDGKQKHSSHEYHFDTTITGIFCDISCLGMGADKIEAALDLTRILKDARAEFNRDIDLALKQLEEEIWTPKNSTL